MPVNPTYPGLYIEEVPSSAHTITPAPTSITVFVGYTHPFQGTVAESETGEHWGKPFQIFSFTEYERIFGGLFQSRDLLTHAPNAVRQFFLNGGSNAYVVGLEPRYFDGSPKGLPIVGASDVTDGIQFTARQLTDTTNKLTVTIRNVRPSVPGGPLQDVADIMITCGREVETYPGVQIKAGSPDPFMDPDHSDYLRDFIGNRLAASRLVRVAPDPLVGQYPSEFKASSFDLVEMVQPASWSPLRLSDFVDVFQEDTPLDKVDIFNLLATPGVFGAGIWDAALAFCERKRAFYVMDPPNTHSADGFGGTLPRIEDLEVPNSVPNGALYFPYVKSFDPVANRITELPPSGFVTGAYARSDRNRGVWKAPAGLETSLVNTTGVVETGRMSDMRQGVLNPLGINVLRSFPGSGTVIWGARTLVTSNPSFQQWRYVPVRRTALFIEQTLLRNLGWVVFEPNDEPLWAAIRLSIENFMLSLFRQSAFQGSTPSVAFLVQCDSTTTTQTDIDNGIVNIVVGFRPLKPAEFVIIKIAQIAGQVQA